jgi:hypothetical protein
MLIRQHLVYAYCADGAMRYYVIAHKYKYDARSCALLVNHMQQEAL